MTNEQLLSELWKEAERILLEPADNTPWEIKTEVQQNEEAHEADACAA